MYKRKRDSRGEKGGQEAPKLLTFIFPDILCDFTAGVAVVKAYNKESAIDKLLEEFDKTKFFKEIEMTMFDKWSKEKREARSAIDRIQQGIRNEEDLRKHERTLSKENYDRIKTLLRYSKSNYSTYQHNSAMFKRTTSRNDPVSTFGTNYYADRKSFEDKLRSTKPFVYGESEGFAFL